MIFEIADPAVHPIENNKYYTVAGIINAQISTRVYQSGKVRQRVVFLTPKRTQCCLEIWSDNIENLKPNFSENWKDLQLIMVVGARYHGISHINDQKPMFVFRLSAFKASYNRFIWLSKPATDESADFWAEPIDSGSALNSEQHHLTHLQDV